MLKAIWTAIVGGNPVSWLALALAFLLVLALAAGTGFYEGTRTCVAAQAKATAGVAARAAAAQSALDARDYAAGRADAAKRAEQNRRAAAAVAQLKADLANLVPDARPSPACPKPPVVPAAAMKRLNDPALVGEVQ